MTNNDLAEKSLPKPERRTIDLILVGLFVAVAVVLLAIAVRDSSLLYRAGRTNDMAVLLTCEAGIAVCMTLCLPLLLLAIIAVVRLLLKWRRSSRRMRIERGIYLLSMVAVFLALFAFVRTGDNPLGEGFQRWVQEKADVGAIRAWAATLTNVKDGDSIPAAVWPPEVAKLSPGWVIKQGASEVSLDWGGGFIDIHYGIVVGPQTLKIPQTDRVWRILPVAPGAYTYSD